MWWLIVVIFAILFAPSKSSDSQEFVPLDFPSRDWWETASFYQIYPRSYKDSNGDGIGDLNGITEQLDYLKTISVSAVWLSPIFKSPMADFGYDIADFYDIQPEYGTLQDFDCLISKAKELNIKVFLDFVPNHSSDENVWFKKSVEREPGFENFYIWHPGHLDKNGNHLPPNNWLSVFRKSAWQWNEERGEFYFHQFLAKQPDLNYRNPTVVNEMKKVLRFWLDRGVDGFRIDAVPHLFEVEPNVDGYLPDEPLSGNTDDPDDYGYLKHIYTVDQPETIDMIYQWRQVLDNYKHDHGGDTKVMMTESYSPLNVVVKYYGNETHNGSHIPFNFQMISRLRNESNAYDYFNCIDDWMRNLPVGRTPNWVIGNHDNSRVASRLGTDRIDSINMILMTLPGVCINYNGEEIGMTDQWISWNNTVDPAACNSNPSIYERFSRDPERTPFQWNDKLNAGFSTAAKTWLPVADNYKEINVAKQEKTEKSHLKIYMDIQNLRKQPTFKYGNVTYATLSEQVLGIMRYLDGQPSYISVVNIGPFQEKINLKKLSAKVPNKLEYYIVGVSSSHQIGEIALSDSISLEPKESFILRTLSSARTAVSSEYYYYNFNAT